jgi:(p)ppGpp synthase/HD superfamily hydrolase
LLMSISQNGSGSQAPQPEPPQPESSQPELPRVEATAAWAGTWHAGQTDKAGQPYIGHLIRVQAHLLRLFPGATVAERHAAWLHDVLEDTDITETDLGAMGYPAEVIDIVRAVTKRDGDPRSYGEWIDTLARTGPIGAVRVKLADLSDNSDPNRLSALPHARAVSMAARYNAAKQRLWSVLDADA